MIVQQLLHLSSTDASNIQGVSFGFFDQRCFPMCDVSIIHLWKDCCLCVTFKIPKVEAFCTTRFVSPVGTMFHVCLCSADWEDHHEFFKCPKPENKSLVMHMTADKP